MAATMVQQQSLDYNSPRLFHGTSKVGSLRSNNLKATLPAGFPASYSGERVWTGDDVASKEDQWIIKLSNDEQLEIMQALQHFERLGLAPQHLSTETFPLSSELHEKLKQLSHDCYDGRGFAVLRGLDPSGLTESQNVLLFGGVSSHVAPVRGFQDLKRELVTCHVVSEETRPKAEEQNLRPAFTNDRLAFHTDLGDILALYSIDAAKSGGKTLIASSSHVYNELMETRPDLMEELSKPWVFFSSHDFDTDGTPLVTNATGDKLVFQYSRLPITGFRKVAPNASVPAPSPKRLEAMSMVEEIAARDCFALPSHQGDLVFINNLTLMHGRSAFDLDAEGRPMPSKRHLVKLMLRDPELAWEMPDSMKWYTERIYGPNRDDGSRMEDWQLTLNSKEGEVNGHMWAGSGALSNG